MDFFSITLISWFMFGTGKWELERAEKWRVQRSIAVAGADKRCRRTKSTSLSESRFHINEICGTEFTLTALVSLYTPIPIHVLLLPLLKSMSNYRLVVKM
nr:hypothetical protein Iba_chr01cCG9800 [Ipomoea batatas]